MSAEPRSKALKWPEVLEALKALSPKKQLLILDAIQNQVWGETTEGLKVSARSPKELLRLQHAKDPRVIDWLRRFAPGDVFYDIGANVGQLTLAAAALHQRQLRIVSIEPSYANFESLTRNLALNGLLSIATPLQVALLDRTSLQPMNYRSTTAGTSLHAVGDAVDHLGQQFAPVEVQMVLAYALDDLIHTFDLPMPTWVKIDVDGFEDQVLQGARATLRRGTIRELEVEVVNHDGAFTRLDAVRQFLGDLGYELTATFDHPSSDPEGKSFVADYLFTNRHLHGASV